MARYSSNYNQRVVYYAGETRRAQAASCIAQAVNSVSLYLHCFNSKPAVNTPCSVMCLPFAGPFMNFIQTWSSEAEQRLCKFIRG